MNWLIPAIIAILSSSAFIAFVYILFYFKYRTDYMKFWAVAWSFYSLRYVFQFFHVQDNSIQWMQEASLLCMILGTFYIAYGFYSFLKIRFSPVWTFLLPFAIVYAFVAAFLDFSLFTSTLPIFTYLGLLYIITGIVVLRTDKSIGLSRYLAGISLVIWGVHKLDYPFLRDIEEAAAYGYLLGSVLLISTAVSILLYFFEKTRKDLSESRIKYKLLADNAYDLIYRYRLKPEPKFEYVSPSATKITGYTPEDHYNDPMLGMKIVHPDDRQILADMIEKGYNPNEAYTLRWIKKGGEVVWIQQRNVPIKNEKGEITALEGIARDVTDSIQNEEKIRRSDQRFESLYQLSKMTNESEKEVIDYALEQAVYITDSHIGYFHFLNDDEISLRLFTWTSKVLENCNTPILGDYPLSEAGVWADCIRERKPVIHNDYENLSDRKGLPEGHVPLTRHMSIPVLYGEKIIAVAGVGNKEKPYTEDDVKQLNMFMNEMWKTIQRHRTQELLRKQNKALEKSTVSIMITDIDGKIEYVNPCFSEMTGYTFDEVIGKNPNILKSEEKSRREYQNLWNTISNGKVWQGEFHNKKKNGTLFWESASIAPIFDDLGNITHYVGVKEDITEKKMIDLKLTKALKKAEEVNRIKSTLFANLSHEFRTPMNGILGFTSLMAMRSQDEKQQDMIRKIRISAQRLMNTLESVLEFAHLSSVDELEDTSSIDVVTILKTFAMNYEEPAAEKGLELTFFSDRQSFFIEANEKIISDILNNLLDNAVKFTEKGRISVEMRVIKKRNTTYAAIKVADTGIGIEQQYKDIIFEEFRQVSEGYSRSHEGAGLGLALTKKMVQLLKGEITISSKLGEGSVFTVTLPASSQQQQVLDLSALTQEPVVEEYQNFEQFDEKMPSVLIVEDNPINAELLEVFLEKHFKVFVAMEGKEALKLSEEQKFAVFVIDINLGIGINGVELMNRLKEHSYYENAPFIAATGYANSNDKERLLKQGFTHHIGKPFEESDILVLMKQIFPNHAFSEII